MLQTGVEVVDMILNEAAVQAQNRPLSAIGKNHTLAGTRVQSRPRRTNRCLAPNQPARALEREDADHLRGAEEAMRALGGRPGKSAESHAIAELDIGHGDPFVQSLSRSHLEADVV